MNAIRNVFTVLSNLAASINTLAGVLDGASNRLQQQLDYEPSLPALPHGEVIDATPEGNGAVKGKRGKATV
jgi:hypothetical protein